MRASGPFDSCISVYKTVSILSEMSIVIAVVDSEDVVVASDGLATDIAGNAVNSKSKKSCALNRRLCLVSAGRSDQAKAIMYALDPRCKDLDEDGPEEDWESRKWTLRMGYQEARDIIRERFAVLVNEVSKKTEAASDAGQSTEGMDLSGFLLCGRNRGPVVAYYGTKSQEDRIVLGVGEVRDKDGIRPIIMGIQPKDSIYGEVGERAELGGSCAGAEDRLVECIRLAVDFNSNFSANKNILTRRLTERFSPCWHIMAS